MDDSFLDTMKLHTPYTIFLYTYRLETAMLTRRVYLDAADAERSVLDSKAPGASGEELAQASSYYLEFPKLTSAQSVEACRTTSPKITIRERRRACRSTNEVQLRMGGYPPSIREAIILMFSRD